MADFEDNCVVVILDVVGSYWTLDNHDGNGLPNESWLLSEYGWGDKNRLSGKNGIRTDIIL